jgi:hypothetical protein
MPAALAKDRRWRVAARLAAAAPHLLAQIRQVADEARGEAFQCGFLFGSGNWLVLQRHGGRSFFDNTSLTSSQTVNCGRSALDGAGTMRQIEYRATPPWNACRRRAAFLAGEDFGSRRHRCEALPTPCKPAKTSGPDSTRHR